MKKILLGLFIGLLLGAPAAGLAAARFHIGQKVWYVKCGWSCTPNPATVMSNNATLYKDDPYLVAYKSTGGQIKYDFVEEDQLVNRKTGACQQ